MEKTNIINISLNHACPSCGEPGMKVFHEADGVPTNSCILLSSKSEALNYPKGDIRLGFCRTCGFVSNLSFDQGLTEYSERYEETQGYSPTFNAFHRDLADHLIKKYNLKNKTIIEIGCGKGEFLTLLCEIGGNRGIGFDPSFIPERNRNNIPDRLTFIRDFYSEKYASYRADFVVCKMTLEHIPNPYDFVRMVRESIGDRKETIVFFQVPDAVRVLKTCAFEDIYYEHCSYFGVGSLARLFQICGFSVVSTKVVYDEQYLMIEAQPTMRLTNVDSENTEYLMTLEKYVTDFQKQFLEKKHSWKQRLERYLLEGKRVVIWGSGSKGVAFLTNFDISKGIEYAVDINPNRHGYFMPGVGQEIVSPRYLKQYKPDIVIIMNEIYYDEISHDVQEMGLEPTLLTI